MRNSSLDFSNLQQSLDQQSQNCLSQILDQQSQNYLSQISGGQISGCSCPPYGGYTYPSQLIPAVYCPESRLGSREFRVWLCGKEIRMNYGEELKILMADPIKGMHLREAVQQLKEALLEL